MQKNFKVEQSNEIILNNSVYDLHNVYDFSGIQIENQKKILIHFTPHANAEKAILPISLQFVDVDYLNLGFSFMNTAILDLDEIGYKNPDDPDDEWLLDEYQSTNIDHLFFRFCDNNFIRIHSRYATVVEKRGFPKK
ncbi:MAG: hypothetical protein GXP32_05335 [Kiritimatiellaeota bacterium]|nr:hypothetical protein [Kiritimatiellota bacterium]